MQGNQEIDKYINKIATFDPAIKASLDPKKVCEKLKRGLYFHEILGIIIPQSIVPEIYKTIEKDKLEETVYSKELYNGKNGNPGLKTYFEDPETKEQIKKNQELRVANPKETQKDDNVYDKESLDEQPKGNDIYEEESNNFGNQDDNNQEETNEPGVGEKLKDAVGDRAKEIAKEKAEKEAVKTAEKSLASNAKKQIFTQAANAVKAAAARVGAVIAANPIPWIIGAVILLIIVAIFVIVFIPGFGKNGNVQASPVDNQTQFQYIVSFDEKELKKLLKEDLGKLIEKMEGIKKDYNGDNKQEITKICDDIIAKAKELQQIIPIIQNDEKNRSQEASEREKVAEAKAKKEVLNKEILKLCQDLLKKVRGATPCLFEPAGGYCGQTSAMMIISYHNPTFPIKQNSSIADYANVGSTSNSDGILNLIQRHLPNKKIIQINQQIGTKNPNYKPLYEQALKNNPVLIGSLFPNSTRKHYMVVTGYAGEKNGDKQYYVNNPNVNGCEKIILSESYFKNKPYPGPDYWYVYAEDK